MDLRSNVYDMAHLCAALPRTGAASVRFCTMCGVSKCQYINGVRCRCWCRCRCRCCCVVVVVVVVLLVVQVVVGCARDCRLPSVNSCVKVGLEEVM